MAIWIKRIGFVVVLAAIAGAFYLAMREKPVLVDIATVARGSMQVTIEEEGTTRVRDIYTVSSPIAGHLERITLDEGDMVKADETVIASIHPPDPPFLDERTRTELVAAIEAARSAVALAEVEKRRAQTAMSLAQSEYSRSKRLAADNVVSQASLEKAKSEVDVREAEVASAIATIRLRKAELASAQARLKQPGDVQSRDFTESCCVELTAPVDGTVLKVLSRSEQAVMQGTKIAEIGDPGNLEITVDLLSSDAARIRAGTPALISEWGGDHDLRAVVRRIDPAGFTKVSALGIEEQRVSAVLDLEEIPPQLGHGYRVLAHLVVWSSNDVVQVPIGALFRSGGAWSVFVVEDGRAVSREVGVGHLNARHAEIKSGLETGDTVILYPSDVVEDGSLVEAR